MSPPKNSCAPTWRNSPDSSGGCTPSCPGISEPARGRRAARGLGVAAGLSLIFGQTGWAQQPTALPSVVVTSTPLGTAPFETPASVDIVDGEAIRAGRPQVSLAEGLSGVPGLVVRDRQNHAQDLQISIRGFGARSTFGVRGLRLYVDGIPATMPDGQGQTSNIDLATVDRIEVLRGPFSALYGNSSGGVIQVFSAAGAFPPEASAGVAVGSDGLRRYSLGASGARANGHADAVAGVTRLASDGYREHSAVRKWTGNARVGLQLDDDSRLDLVVNAVDVDADDPLGLDAQAFRSAPRSAASVARTFDTRKTVRQAQAGAIHERRLDGGSSLRLMLYYGQRETVQFQSIPVAVQANPRHAGGVISLERDYGGLDLRWTGQGSLAGRPLRLAAGVAYDHLSEHRQGHENFQGEGGQQRLGVRGALRRDERNRVWNLDPYAQASWQLAERWTLDAGLRRSRIRFDSDDRYQVGANGDDSGSARYARLLPVGALRFEASPALSLYATVGRGFETPTFNEISYRPDGLGGLNFALRPSVNTSVELGAKLRVAHGLLSAAVFETRTRDEIVSAGSSGGRTTFRNAGRTLRQGIELAWSGELAPDWKARLAWAWLDARFRDDACAPECAPGEESTAGRRLPGVARQAAYASLDWAPARGWRAGVEGRYSSAVAANDLGSANAPGYFVSSAYVGYLWTLERWTVDAFARVDNLFDRHYAGSVIVNESNGRYFEPAPGRNWSAGLALARRF